MKAKNMILALAFAALVTVTGYSFQEPTPSAIEQQYRKGELVVELKPGASIQSINDRFGTTTIQRIYGTNFYRLRTPKGKKEAKWRKRLAKDSDVLSAALNPTISNPSLFARATLSFPDGYAKPGMTLANFEAQQALFGFLKLEDVLLRSRGGGVTVAIIDTGIAYNHPMFANRLWRDTRTDGEIEGDGIDNDADGLVDDTSGWDFVENDNDPSDEPGDPETTVAGHGTFIAGLITTLAPDARILPVRAFPADGISDGFTVAAAVKYAADHGANVINLSLGSPETLELLQEAILDARQRGIAVIAAVGNENDESAPQFPSVMPDVMAVAAIELTGSKARFSNFGNHVDVCAPGVSLVSAYPAEDRAEFAEWSGTSFAAPFVAAEAALVMAADPRSVEVKRAIEATAVSVDDMNPGFSGKLGRGRIDPLAALQSLNVGDDTRRPYDARTEIMLSRGSAALDAAGKAVINVTGATQEFLFEAHRLNVRTKYKLVVDGQTILPEVAASSLGSIRLFFSNGGNGIQLPPHLNPVTEIRRVELRDSLDRVALAGEFKSQDGLEVIARVVEKESRLVSATGSARVGGFAAARIESLSATARRESLVVSAEGLADGAYQLVVDGTIINAAATRAGFFRAHLTSDNSSGALLPAELRPVTNVRRVEVRDGAGRIVLQGDFPAR